jgi:hypothetical protein
MKAWTAAIVAFAVVSAVLATLVVRAHPEDAARYDVDENGFVNSADLGLVAAHFGQVATATMTPALGTTDTPSPTPTVGASACTAPTALPVGAIPGQPPPVFCTIAGFPPDTFISGDNTWSDDFDQPMSFVHLSPAYNTYALGPDCRAIHWQHNVHWMVDFVSDGCRGVMMRPDRSFRFIGGKLVIEADVAAGYEPYGGALWPELVVSTSPNPTEKLQNGLYAYSEFRGAYAAGCRLQASRRPVCAMYDPTDDGEGPPDRNTEVSFFQHEGSTATGGGEWMGGWRACAFGDPDTNCRDRFRWEITKDTWTLYVNDVLFMEHRDMQPSAQIPDAFLNSDVYVYFADWGAGSIAETARFHWQSIAINP